MVDCPRTIVMKQAGEKQTPAFENRSSQALPLEQAEISVNDVIHSDHEINADQVNCANLSTQGTLHNAQGCLQLRDNVLQ